MARTITFDVFSNNAISTDFSLHNHLRVQVLIFITINDTKILDDVNDILFLTHFVKFRKK